MNKEQLRRYVAKKTKECYVGSKGDIGITEMFLCILSALGSFTTYNCIKVARAIQDSKTEEGRAKHDLLGDYSQFGMRRKAELLEQGCKRFESSLIKHSRNAESVFGRVNIEEEIANMLDATDEVLKPFMNELSDYFWRKIPKTGPLHPLDSWLLHDVMMCRVLTSSMVNVYDKAVDLLPVFERNRDTNGYFNLLPQMQDVNHITASLRWLNGKREPLKYNIEAVLTTDEIMDICNHLTAAIMSSKFIDLMFYIREGVDNEFRYKCCALCENIPYSQKLDISKWLECDIERMKYNYKS